MINILLVEDNDGDIFLTKEAFSESNIANEIRIAKDGEQAIDFFESINDNNMRPDLVLLDINMPKMGGIDVLRYIKNEQNFKRIPVIMLTTSSSEKDIIAAYENYANCYITKPLDVEDFGEVVSQIENFWFRTASLPSKKSRQ